MSDEEKDNFVDTELGPNPVKRDNKDLHLQIDIDKEDSGKENSGKKDSGEEDSGKEDSGKGDLDNILIKEIKQNISRNSLEIADLKNNKQIDSGISEGSNPITPRDGFKHPEYVFANIFNEPLDDTGEWTDLKRYRFLKCLWKLKYNRVVSSFYLNNLKNSEHKWSWMIIMISTLTSGLTVANNVEEENAPIQNYNTYVNIFLTVSSMSTSLIAAWIKKQMFVEKINEIDKYLYELNALCEDLEIQLSLLNTDRLTYKEFKGKYIPQLTQYLTTNPIIPPEEWKACIREITMDYPEILNIDDSEDNKMWPWYGDLIVDPNSEDVDKHHVRYPTSFYRKLKKSKKEKLRSSCCGGGKVKTVYNNNN